MKRLRYTEGSWFVVPLSSGRHAIGIVARRSRPAGVVLGYFFCGPGDSPTMADVAALSAEDAVAIRRFGDLGLIRGEWPIIGVHGSWNRAQWPVPEFVRRDPVSGLAQLITYSDDDVSLEVGFRWCDPSVDAIKDSMLGAGALEMLLDQECSRRS
jgi:hypothetical protein